MFSDLLLCPMFFLSYPCFGGLHGPITSTLNVMHCSCPWGIQLSFFSITNKTAVSIRASWGFSGVRYTDVGLLVGKVGASSNMDLEANCFAWCLYQSALTLAMNENSCYSMASPAWATVIHISQGPSKKRIVS